jgi:formate hydrogenlyase subunit 3/multisubunit Na+/H+ antiporter MnhD subunit
MKKNKTTGLCCLSALLIAAPVLGFLIFLALALGWQKVAEAVGFVIVAILAMVSIAAGGLIAMELLEQNDKWTGQ